MKTATLVALAFLAGPGLAAAQPPSAAPTMSIRYADLRLADARDARTMLVRIRKAAVEVCRVPGQDGNDAAAVEHFDACYRQTVKQSVDALNAPLVTAAFQPGPDAPVLARR